MNTSRPLQNELQRFSELRKRMVRDQLVARGIRCARVLDVMRGVPREEFVPQPLQCEAYEDLPLPIGFGQTISQPFTVAYMTEALKLNGAERVLEIGTGSGYAAAVLASLATEVHTIERIASLAQQAQSRLARLGFDNVHVQVANGTQGLINHAPFDAIVVTAGADELPEPYVEQLADGGRIVIPIGVAPTNQSLFRFTRSGPELSVENLGQFTLVPLIGENDWPDVSAS